jgi:SAM-dependent methyltransferase
MAMDEKKIKELAHQLRQPNGVKGIEVADLMNETNKKMTFHSINHLNLIDNDNILELGHGNCGHLSKLLQLRKNLTYYGLETSDLMVKEAVRINEAYINRNQAFYHLYNGIKIPFSDNFFDKAFTVNTIYFWAEPELLISELYRILKPNGILNITFAQKDFMEQLSFSQFGFSLYDNEKIKQLIATSAFSIKKIETETETIKSKTGDFVDREFVTVILSKSPNY